MPLLQEYLHTSVLEFRPMIKGYIEEQNSSPDASRQ